MIVLDGQSALSPFRLDRLNARLEAVHRGLRARAAGFVHTLDASAITAPRTREELCTILEAHAAAPAPATLWVVPRLGTVSPWSSKASDILRGAASRSAPTRRRPWQRPIARWVSRSPPTRSPI